MFDAVVRILLASTDDSLQQQVSAIAAPLGSSIDVANPDEVLASLEGTGYDVLIGPRDGLEALVPLIRVRLSPRVRPIVVTVTADVDSQERIRDALRRAMAAGREIADDNLVNVRVVNRLRELQQPGDVDLVRALVGMFRDQAATRIDALREACGVTDRERTVRTAHSLKGSAANMGAYRLARLCAVIEREAGSAEPRLLEAWGSLAVDLFVRSVAALTRLAHD